MVFSPEGSYGDAPVAEIRGWGRLRGKLGLSDEEAMAEQERIGKLIAASPELLIAAERVIEYSGGNLNGDNYADVMSALIAAVKKARG